MGITCVSSRTICHSSSVKKWRYLVLGKQGLELRLLPWQHYRGYHFVSYLMYITGAKFEWHQWNISRDILDFVIIFLLKLFVTSSIFKQKLEYLRNERRSFKKECAILIDWLIDWFYWNLNSLQITRPAGSVANLGGPGNKEKSKTA